MPRRLLYLLPLCPLPFLAASCGDPVADHVRTIMSGRAGRQEAVMELLFAKGEALPAVLAALRDPALPAAGRADLVEVLWKIHVREADPRILPALLEALEDKSAAIRAAAATAFTNIGNREVLPRLLNRLSAEDDGRVQYELLAAIEVVDQWRLDRGSGGEAAFRVRGGEALDDAQRRTFMLDLRRIAAAATADSLRGAAEEFLHKLAAQRVGEGDERILSADLQGSEALYRQALEIHPDSPSARQRLAQLALFEGDRGEGLRRHEAAGLLVRVPHLRKVPLVDGRFDETEWAGAAHIDSFYQCVAQMRRIPADGRSEARIGYTDSTLCVAVRGYEDDTANLTASIRERDGPVHTDDCVEVHVDADLDRRQFQQWVVNSIGALADHNVGEAGYGGGQPWNGSARVAAHVAANSWSAELQIPLRDLGVKAIRRGDLWGFNVARVRIAHGGEYDQWVPTFGFAGRPDRFGLLLFE